MALGEQIEESRGKITGLFVPIECLEGTMYYLDFNDWLEMIDAGCKWDAEQHKKVCS